MLIDGPAVFWESTPPVPVARDPRERHLIELRRVCRVFANDVSFCRIKGPESSTTKAAPARLRVLPVVSNPMMIGS